jgi:3'(2'), 5'-bisphosphate nucleotidase
LEIFWRAGGNLQPWRVRPFLPSKVHHVISDPKILDTLADIALRAGAAICGTPRDALAVRTKKDGSPVTRADLAANEAIFKGLSEAFPSWPVISEESAPSQAPATSTFTFLVDPLDGTREFVRGSDQFTVNIALLETGIPVAGVIYAPAIGVIYGGTMSVARRASVTEGAIGHWQPVRAASPSNGLRALTSHSHATAETRDFLESHAIESVRSVGSSLKFCLIAEGQADIYPRLGQTMEWDTAAGDAILRAAGGSVTMLDGKPLRYLKRDEDGHPTFENPWFIAAGAFDPFDARWRAISQAPNGKSGRGMPD